MPRVRPALPAIAVVFGLLIAASGTGCDRDDDRASQRQCKELRAHRVELRIRASTRDAKNADAHRKALLRALGPEPADIERCRRRYSRAEIRCALAATDLSELSKCDQASTPTSRNDS